jgi:branched-chain amino acid transport system permease protein
MSNVSPASTLDSPPDLSALPGRRFDWAPIALVALLVLVMLPLIGSATTWITLTVAGLAMGLILFVMASGLTLVFGLMDVLNLEHAAFVTVGAYAAVSAAAPLKPWLDSESGLMNMLAVTVIGLAAVVVTTVVGFIYERLFIRAVHGSHFKQSLITIGGLIIVQQCVLVIWGPNQMQLLLPGALRGVLVFGDVAVERFRLFAVVVGLLLYLAMSLVMQCTRVGLLIRAGVENREMVESLGHHIRRMFVLVFVAGAALAGLGGAMWGFYREQFSASIGADVLVQILIITIIGGLGSVSGCFCGAVLIALCTNYISYLAPDLALVSDVLVMMAILLWRPSGLYPLVMR